MIVSICRMFEILMAACVTYPKPLEWRGVHFSADLVADRSGNVISRSIVTSIVLRNGHHSSHPIVEMIVGLLCFFASIATPVFYFVGIMPRGGLVLVLVAPVLVLLLVVSGVTFIFRALRRGFFLDVSYEGGSTRLGFRKKPKIEDIESFLKSAESEFGFVVERSMPTAGFPLIKRSRARRTQG